jgi:hypothetical protein
MKNKQKSLLIALLMMLFISIGLHAQQDSLNFPAPQYMLPFYDHFTLNHLNVAAMGRGQTTNALIGKVENAVNNPATLESDKAFLYMELTIKPPINEINSPDSMRFSSPIPFGMVGISGKLFNNIYGAISYNVPKSVVYDSWIIPIDQGNDFVQRYPSYYLHQLTTTIAGNIGNLRLGLNIHQQLHQFTDIAIFQTFDRVDKVFYDVRIQPGVFYQTGQFGLGATVTAPTKTTMDVKYAEYDVTMPMQVTAGASFHSINNSLYADLEWEQFSKMSSRFDDRLTLKGGFEHLVRNTIYRLGVISMPGVYTGAYRLPVSTPDEDAALIWWKKIPRGGFIKNTDQLYLTAGFSYYFKGGEISLGIMRDVLGNVPTTQFATSIGFNLDTLKGKKFLMID